MKKKKKSAPLLRHAVSCDLHTHSFYSDGALSPEETAQAAAGKNVRYWALTDHDTVDGLPEAAAAAADAGIVFIPGTEITIEDYEGRPFHLLGLGVDGRRARLSALCRRQSARRRERFLEICRRIAAHGIPVDGESILTAEKGAPGRLRIARELIRLKEVCSLQEAFARYLGAHTGNVVPFEFSPMSKPAASTGLKLSIRVVPPSAGVIYWPPRNGSECLSAEAAISMVPTSRTPFPAAPPTENRFPSSACRLF